MNPVAQFIKLFFVYNTNSTYNTNLYRAFKCIFTYILYTEVFIIPEWINLFFWWFNDPISRNLLDTKFI